MIEPFPRRRGKDRAAVRPWQWGKASQESPPARGRRVWAALAAMTLVALIAGPGVAQTDNNLHGRLEVQDAGQFTGSDSLQAAFGERRDLVVIIGARQGATL